MCSAALAMIALLVTPYPTTISTVESAVREYRIRFYHTHTGERIDVVYRKGDTYIPEAISLLEYHLRDHRTGDVQIFDLRLFDLLNDLTSAAGLPDAEIEVISGYRSPWSNEFLRRRSCGVARYSLHMQGMAIDIRIPGIDTSYLHELALSLSRGGVGYYPGPDFVHVDVGPVRQW